MDVNLLPLIQNTQFFKIEALKGRTEKTRRFFAEYQDFEKFIDVFKKRQANDFVVVMEIFDEFFKSDEDYENPMNFAIGTHNLAYVKGNEWRLSNSEKVT